MKYIITLVLSLVSLSSFGQTTTKNYIKTIAPREAVTSITPATKKTISVQYVDGLGRPVQSIQVAGSPSQKDIVMPVEYDLFGRQVKQYLPYVSDVTSEDFRSNALNQTYSSSEHYDFYTDQNRSSQNTEYGFAETRFDASPLNRTLEKGAPGEDWQIGQHTVKMDYEFNTALDAVTMWEMGELQVSAQNHFPSNELYKNIVTDEDGNRVIEFKDKRNRVILKRNDLSGYTKQKIGFENEAPFVTMVSGMSFASDQALEEMYSFKLASTGSSYYAAPLSLGTVADGYTINVSVWVYSAYNTAKCKIDVANSSINFVAEKSIHSNGKWQKMTFENVNITEVGDLRISLGAGYYTPDVYFDKMVVEIQPLIGPSDYADTYYVYDERDRLKVVLPPESNNAINKYYKGLTEDGFELHGTNTTVPEGTNETPNWAYSFDASITIGDNTTLSPGTHIKPLEVLTPDFLATWAFQYEYDGRNRMISKQVPGAEPFHMVYDQWDRLVLTQDGNQRDPQKGTGIEWLFTSYDELNRPVITGVIRDSKTRAQLQSSIGAISSNYRFLTYDGTGSFGYNQGSYPFANAAGAAIENIYTVTYYDDYGFKSLWSDDLDFTNPSTPALTQHTAVKGQVTGNMTKYGTDWIKSVTYYDDKYRPIQSQSTNHLDPANGSKDIVTNYFDFIGQMDKTISSHYDGSKTTEITRFYDYDHVGRLLKTWHQIGSNVASKKLIAFNEYNELGELKEKNLHYAGSHPEPDEGDFQQNINFSYNIRGWLTDINNPESTDAQHLFGFRLHYNENTLDPTKANFNGNISGMAWSSHSDQKSVAINARGCTFNYDGLNRLESTESYHKYSGWTTTNQFETDYTYDMNGNIETLDRSHLTSANIDELSYDYDGNQLLSVTDASNNDQGFKDGNTSGDDYAYDANGNMVVDKNKGITSINYNHLNLPTTVILSNSEESGRIEYLYDAVGIKLQQKVFEGNTLKKTKDYVGEFIYETEGNNSRKLQLIQQEEGRIIPLTASHPEFISGSKEYDYQYHLKDHLGNARLTFSTTPDNFTMVEDFEDLQSDFQKLNPVSRPQNTTSGGIYMTQTLKDSVNAVVVLSLNKGDTINLSVNANYPIAPSESNFAQTGWDILFGVFGDAYTKMVGETAQIPGSSTNFGYALNGTGMADKENPSTEPRAFLNYIIFDRSMTFDSQNGQAGYVQVSSAALGTNVENLSINSIAEQDGYLVAYLSNENSSQVDVFFDDFTVYHGKTNIVSTDDYYPFGLTFNSSVRTASTPQKYLYNEKELQEETGWLDYGARMYQPELGRFFTQDRYAEKYYDLNPYQYGANNPIKYVDINGDSLWIKTGEGNLLYQDNKVYSKGENGELSEYKGKYAKLDKEGNVKRYKGTLGQTVGALNKLGSKSEFAGGMISSLQGSENNFVIAPNENLKGSYAPVELGNGKYGVLNNNAYALQVIDQGENTVNYAPFNAIGSGGEVRWKPSQGWITLGHELGHMYDANSGTLDSRTVNINGGSMEIREIRATYYENRIRQDAGKRLRTNYSGGPRLIDANKNPIFYPTPLFSKPVPK